MKFLLSSTDLTEKGHPSKGDQLLISAAKERGLEARVIDPLKISYCFSDIPIRVYDSGINISDADILLFRRTRGAELESYQLARTMEEKGATVVDPSQALIYPVSKLISQVLRSGKYTPETLFVPNFSEQSSDQILKNLKFPIIVKPQNGTKGKGFNILKDETAARKYFAAHRSDPSIAQEYLDIVTFIRVLTIGRKIAGSSYCLGTMDYSGQVKSREIAKEIIEDNPAGILGIDIVKTREGKYYVLECNRNPDFTLMPKTNDSYEDKIIEYCLSLKKEQTPKSKIEPEKVAGRKSIARRLYEKISS